MNTDLSEMVTEEWLHECPCGLLVMQNGKVRWANSLLEQWTGLRNQDIQGIAPEDAGAARLESLLAPETSIVLNGSDGKEVRLRRRTRRLDHDREGELELHWFSDFSAEYSAARERDMLRYKVEELDLTDPLTGLANRRSLGNSLVAQVTRSRRYHNPLSLIMVRVAIPGMDGEIPQDVVLGISRFLRDRLRWADVIGRYTETQFMLILPETQYEDAARLAASIRDEAESIVIPPPHDTVRARLEVGVAQWQKGQDTERLVTAALTQFID